MNVWFLQIEIKSIRYWLLIIILVIAVFILKKLGVAFFYLKNKNHKRFILNIVFFVFFVFDGIASGTVEMAGTVFTAIITTVKAIETATAVTTATITIAVTITVTFLENELGSASVVRSTK